jgi:hypothetical protein
MPRWNVSARRNLDTPWSEPTHWPPRAFRWFLILTTLCLAIAVCTFVLLVVYR